MRSILLHTCCAPCTIAVRGVLQNNDFDITGFFYNPNIKPAEEYVRRLITMEYYAAATSFQVLYEQNDVPHESGRCENCYALRLAKTAQRARELGYDCFSTTLLISPYQDHELIRETAERVSERSGVEFFYQDFRIYFRAGQQRARELKLYRQRYCGCGAEKLIIT